MVEEDDFQRVGDQGQAGSGRSGQQGKHRMHTNIRNCAEQFASFRREERLIERILEVWGKCSYASNILMLPRNHDKCKDM